MYVTKRIKRAVRLFHKFAKSWPKHKEFLKFTAYISPLVTRNNNSGLHQVRKLSTYKTLQGFACIYIPPHPHCLRRLSVFLQHFHPLQSPKHNPHGLLPTVFKPLKSQKLRAVS